MRRSGTRCSRASLIIVILSHALATLSTVQSVGAIYLLSVSGIRDTVCVAELAMIVASWILSSIYLGYHLVLARRYQKIWLPQRLSVIRNRECLTILAFAAVTWFAAYILGLIISLRRLSNSGLGVINGFKIFQEAGFAGPLSSFISAVFLFCASWMSDRPFAASLQGVHDISINEEDNHHLPRKVSIVTIEGSSFGQPAIPHWPSQSATPITRSSLTLPLPTKMTAPEPALSPQIQSPPKRRRASDSTGLSNYSTGLSFWRSTRWHRASSLSSVGTSVGKISRKSSIRSSRSTAHLIHRPEMPNIPQKYRHTVHPVTCSGGKPMRPASRPSMPPAAFWKYVAEQQERIAVPGTLQSWQLAIDTMSEPSACRTTVRASLPENSAARNKSLHKSNQWVRKRRSYESVWKGIIDIYEHDLPYPGTGRERIGKFDSLEAGRHGGEKRRHVRGKRLVKKTSLQLEKKNQESGWL